jgi:UDP-4-amino-4,6-dideoxy-N-acetyl-beta-L-altrosamine N-acetyltransferase
MDNKISIELRAVEEKDLEMIMNWRMRPEITKFMYTDPTLTLEMQRTWFEKIKVDENSKHWVIELETKPIGLLSINEIDYKNKRCNWAYYVAESESRSMELALALEWNIYDYVFEYLKLNKLVTEVFAFNKAVIKLHQICGSQVEGTLIQHICKDSLFYDITVLGMYVQRWQEIKVKKRYPKIIFE